MNARWWVIPVLLAATLAACGGDSDDEPEDTPAPGEPTNTAPAGATATTTTGGGGDDEGTARLTIGDETFEFEITCQFGTGIITGPGTNQDGELAHLTMGMPVNDQGRPANNPADVNITVSVGLDTAMGASLYQYRITDTLGRVVSYTDDARRVEGQAEFIYQDNDGARAGLSYDDVVEGTFEATCP